MLATAEQLLRDCEHSSRARCEAAVLALSDAQADGGDHLGAVRDVFARLAASRNVPGIKDAMAACASHGILQLAAVEALLAVAEAPAAPVALVNEPRLPELLIAALHFHGRTSRPFATAALRAITLAVWPAARVAPLPAATAHQFVLRDATILGVRGAAVDAHVAVVAAEWQRPQHGGDGEHGLRPRGRRAGQRARGPALRIRDRRPREHKEQHRHDRLLAGTPHQDASTTEQRYTEHHDGAR